MKWGDHVMIRNIALVLIAFAGVCWLGAAWVGISNASSGAEAATLSVLNMFNGAASTSALIAIALGIWLKD